MTTAAEQDMLDSMIMDIEVEPSKVQERKIRVKFYAISGGTGPDLTMSPDLLRKLHRKINEFWKAHPEFQGL